ncbi:MAG: pyruvate kinase [Solirubrobacteraceae bacterium]|nr:pyruvate kinase [Solirubrobacteraceae bacterium]
MTRRTKIVATIGPASRDPETMKRMVDAGMDVARLNFSHGTPELHAENVERLRAAADAAGRPVAVLQDLPGPKLRIGPVEGETVMLQSDSTIHFTCGEEIPGNATHLSVGHPSLAEAIQPGEVFYLSDGRIRLRAGEVDREKRSFDAVVEFGGRVGSRAGLNVPGEANALPSVPDEDLRLLGIGEEIGVDLVALSFVRRAEDVEVVRRYTRLPLIAKIEKPQAVERAESIARAADCLMVARGDLGIELPIEEVPLAQKHLISLAGRLARPVITATQMLDSMVTSSRPTRAEATDVANAILDGTDAVMLSQETAIGEHPVGAIEMMAAIATTTERAIPYQLWNESRVHRDERDPAYTLAHSACVAARELGLDALVIPTLSGRSARLVSAHRPSVPIYALSPGQETVRRCGLMWGVQASSMPRMETTEELIEDACRRVVELGWCQPGQRVGVTAGLPSGRPGTTSLLQIQTLPSAR